MNSQVTRTKHRSVPFFLLHLPDSPSKRFSESPRVPDLPAVAFPMQPSKCRPLACAFRPLPLLLSSGCPSGFPYSPASTAGSMMIPRRNSNLAPSACAAGEFSSRFEACTSPSRSPMPSSTFLEVPCPACALHFPPASIASRIVLLDLNCVSNSLQRHQLKRKLGPANLWTQV